MKRAGNLWPQLISFRNLLSAALAAAAGKRTRPDVSRFLLQLEPELIALQRELSDGSYRSREYSTFHVLDPKPRLISAAPFRDRVVHHAFTRVVEPIFEKRFTADSFACRKGFGTHRALACARKAFTRHPYALKCDVRKYFASIDHQILKVLLERVIKCARTLDLAALIIGGSNPQEDALAYFPGDNLFTPHERRRGLPLGNQTSQFFANVYLNPLDHYVKRELRPAAYMRYVDDFLLIGDSKPELNEMRRKVDDFLCGLRLRIHPGKSRVYRTEDGVTFLGWQLFPERARLDPGNVARFRRSLREMHAAFQRGHTRWEEIKIRVSAWIAHASHGDTWRLRRGIFARYKFTKGGAV